MSAQAHPLTDLGFTPEDQPQGKHPLSDLGFDPEKPSATSTQPPPNALQRFSEVTLGTQHPFDEARRELGDIYHHPGEALKSAGELVGVPREIWSDPSMENVGKIGGTGIPGMAFGEHGLLRHPIEFGEQITGANQGAEDARTGNWKALPGDIAGGLTNLLTMKKPFEAGAGTVKEGLHNAGQTLAETARTPEGKLTPTAKTVASLGGGLLGHQLGIPGVGELGGLFKGPAVADALIPQRTIRPLLGGAYEEPLSPVLGPETPTEAQFRRSAKMSATTSEASPSRLGGSNLSNRFILSPDEWNAKDQIQDIAKRQASERGMLYAGGMRPGKLTPAPPSASPELRGNPTPFESAMPNASVESSASQGRFAPEVPPPQPVESVARAYGLIWHKPMLGLEMATDPVTGSTLNFRESEMNPGAVRSKVLKARATFGKSSEQ